MKNEELLALVVLGIIIGILYGICSIRNWWVPLCLKRPFLTFLVQVGIWVIVCLIIRMV